LEPLSVACVSATGGGIRVRQALAGLEVLLNGPAQPGDGDQCGQRHRARVEAAVEGGLAGAAVVADQQVPVPGCLAADGDGDGDPGSVVPALSLGAGPGGQPLPGPPRQAGGELISTQRAPGPGRYPVIARDREYIGDVLPL